MQLVFDNGAAVDLKDLKVLNVKPGDVLIYQPDVELTQKTFDQIMEVVDFIEKSLEGVHVLMLRKGDVLSLIKEGINKEC